MTERLSPSRWANRVTRILNTVLGEERFPVKVTEVARELSAQLFPDDPISLVKGASLPGFEGALYPDPSGKKGWAILYNTDIASPGRRNFTLAHEFGHYLVHRLDHPEGLECSQQDMVRWDSAYRQLEQQANQFAAGLLMPLDDFRRRIDADAKPRLDDISGCADRYEVSLIAAILPWLEYTARRAVLVVSRDGFILWARSSKRALKTGAYFKTAGQPPVPVPDQALPHQRNSLEGSKGAISHDTGVWFKEPCEELVLFSDQYDFTVSLLHLANTGSSYTYEEESEEDVYDRMTRRTPGTSWLE